MNTGDNSKLDSLKIVQEIVVHKVKDNFQKPERDFDNDQESRITETISRNKIKYFRQYKSVKPGKDNTLESI